MSINLSTMSNADRLGLPLFGWLLNHSPLVMLVIGWAITPGMMIVIGLVLESRWIFPRHQKFFYSFMPGDLFLGGTLACSLALAPSLPASRSVWWQSGLWHACVLVCSVFGCLEARRLLDKPLYTDDALWSPTKMYHDFVLYIGYGFLLVSVAGPTLLRWEWSGYRLAGLACLLVWLGLLVADQVYRDPRELAWCAHRSNWMPIWFGCGRY